MTKAKFHIDKFRAMYRKESKVNRHLVIIYWKIKSCKKQLNTILFMALIFSSSHSA